MKVNNFHCYGLVDSGAAISICSREILSENDIKNLDTSNKLSVRGVSGNLLNVLGSITVNCSIGEVALKIRVTVVDHMADSVFIIGRDVLEPNQCVINYRNLTLEINDHKIPLLKGYSGKRLKKSMAMHVSQTYVIPPYSTSTIKCHIKSKNKGQSKTYLTITGALSPSPSLPNHAVVPHSLLNTNRGTATIQAHNMSEFPLYIYKNSKLGTFSTFHASELNYLKSRYQYSEGRDKTSVKFPQKSDYTYTDSDNIAPTNAVNFTNTDNCDSGASNEIKQPEQIGQQHDTSAQADHTGMHSGRWQGDSISKLYEKLGLNELNHLSENEKSRLQNLVSEYRDIFAESDMDMSCTDLAEQEIILKDTVPVRGKYYNVPLALKAKAEKEVQRLMDLQIIEPSNSTYHSPSFVMQKPDGSGLRLLTDFRQLNAKIQRTYAPVPSLQELVALWHGCKYFSTLDFQFGFYQTSLSPKSRHLTATSLPGISFFQYKKSPMGLSSSPGFFQSLVEKCLLGLKHVKGCVSFLDDILAGSGTFDEHIENLRAIFGRIRASKMLLKPSKCKLVKPKIRYLGHILSEKGISTCPEKVESIDKMAPPKNCKLVKSFLGLSGFYRRFIRNYSKIVEPLTRMTRKNAKFEWTKEAETAWKTIKEKLKSDPILVHPDLSKPYYLIFDASAYAVGAILAQKGDDDQLHAISYGSSILSDAQRKWSTVQRELYSLVYFCEKYETYLLNSKFIAITDNSALLHLDTFKNSKTDRLWRWFQTLSKFEFSIEHRPSQQNPSDALSRLPKNDDALIDSLPKNAVTDRPNLGKNPIAGICTVEPAEQHTNEASNNVKQQTLGFTSDKLQQAQDNDDVLKIVKAWVNGSVEKPKSSYNMQGEMYTYFHSCDRLKIIDNVLCREWETKTLENARWLACVPKALQEETISRCHNPPESGHFAAEKTLNRIRTTFYFPKMNIKVQLYIGQCEVCHKRKRTRQKLKAPLTPFSGTAPGEIVFMDLMEGLPVVNGYQSILVIIDSFSKWCECIPLRDTKAETIARVFLTDWCTRQGLCHQLHSDKAGNLHTGNILRALYKMLNIFKTANIAYRPQTDGTAERMIGTLKSALWKYCQENPRDWISRLDLIVWGYRSSVHASTGHSPFFMDKGRVPRLPLHLWSGTKATIVLGENYGKHAYELYHRLQDVYSKAHKSIKSKQLSSKTRYDDKINVQTFKEGDWVYVWKPPPHNCESRKFYDPFRGPFKIVNKLTEHQYRIELSPGKFDVVHMEFLKAALKGGAPPAQQGDSRVAGDNGSRRPQNSGGVLARSSGRVAEQNSRENDRMLVSVPTRRYPMRNRTQHVPFQHPHGRR